MLFCSFTACQIECLNNTAL
uniref:Uncharacterized protein n=1 Tax=Anguilla anguilla TaxID=7936 RepID=A0A0E9T6U5_ANGAN